MSEQKEQQKKLEDFKAYRLFRVFEYIFLFITSLPVVAIPAEGMQGFLWGVYILIGVLLIETVVKSTIKYIVFNN